MKPNDRIVAARKAKKLSQARVAQLLDTPNQNISRLEKGQTKVSPEWAERLSKVLGVTAKYILFGDENVTTGYNPQKWQRLPLTTLNSMGYVEAGAWRDVSTSEPPEREVLVPRDDRYPRAKQFCLEVRGDSMNAAKPIPILEGALIRCVDFIDSGVELKTGQIAVVQRTRDGGHLIETTVKRVAVLADRIELRPESTNPAHTPILWNEETETTGETRVIALVTAILNEIQQN